MEKEAIEKLMKETSDKRKYIKLCVINLNLDGYKNCEIAKILKLDEHTVGNYINKYKENGFAGLEPKKQPGRPTILTKEQEEQLYKVISEKTPDELGFEPFKNWTSKLACLWVKEVFDEELSIGGMTDLFHRIGLSHTRPTYVLAKADEEKQKQFIDEFNNIKKN